jgi:dihydroorotate dehydrogenase electron transfer subunit
MTHYADSAISTRVQIVDHYALARDTMCLRVAVPAEMCSAVPGQFFMLRDIRGTDPLIGRAFALYDCNAQEGWIEIVYLVKGKLTSSIAALTPGNEVGLCGPLGNSFEDSPTDHLIMVVGGIGQTPMVCLTKEATGKQRFGSRNFGYARRVSLCYGVRTREYLAGVDSFEKAGAQVHVATEDGSIGPPQRVTAVLLQLLKQETDLTQVRIVCCGPEPMMEAVAQIAGERKVRCQVSLETPMACGIGICFTCVAKVGCETDWDYKRTCVEGPVFDASDVVW